jgi:NhaP-type Na+/H+ or K+/H+ antiporter
MREFETILVLLLAVAAIALLARRIQIPYPILLVIGGVFLGFVPQLPKIQLDPELVFVLFLPPLLYPAALFTSWRDFKANLRPILLLAIGLVLFTASQRRGLCIILLDFLWPPLSWARLSRRLMRSPRWPLQKGCACLAASSLFWMARAL